MVAFEKYPQKNFYRAMLCISTACRHAVSVCPAVTYVRAFCQNESSDPETSLPSRSHTILDFPYQTL